MSVVRRTSTGGAEKELVDESLADGVVIDLTDSGGSTVGDPRADRRHRTHLWSEVLPPVSVIIPTINEEQNLPHVLPKIPEWVSEVLIVDGNSDDRTVEVALEVMPSVRIIHQTGTGKGDAMAAGFAAATGEILVSIDADGSMDPAELITYIGSLMAGADLVKGSRFMQGGGTVDMEYHRRAGNRLLVWLTRILYGGRFSDLCYGYVAFWRDVLDVINPDADGFEIEAMINARALRGDLVIAEVPSFEERRLHGVSNLNTFRDGWRVLMTLIRERLPDRFRTAT